MWTSFYRLGMNNPPTGRLTQAEIDNWFIAMVRRFGDRFPKLREMCILVEFPYIYRGTRTEDGARMVVDRDNFGRMAHRDEFPIGIFQ
ncbi:hypothetical protein QQX98_001074 [Neonectria punicea]|uniref:Uncharacterized protein n=1 Tax=Neonectria punicea TaxID=979145 RepID=A0ABR1HQP0_9HYPO